MKKGPRTFNYPGIGIALRAAVDQEAHSISPVWDLG